MEEIRRLKREGLSVSAIASLTGRDRKTVRKYLDETINKPVYKQREARPGRLAGYTGYLEGRVKAGVWNAVVLLRELREQGYSGGTGRGRAAVRDSPRRAGAGGLGLRGGAGAGRWHAAVAVGPLP